MVGYERTPASVPFRAYTSELENKVFLLKVDSLFYYYSHEELR